MAAPGVEVYGLPHCTTCQKALAWLAARGVAVASFRDVKADPLSRAEIDELARRVGGAAALFSRRALKYRAMGLHDRDLTDGELLRLMTEEYTFITRPVIVLGDRATAGFAPVRIARLVGGGE